MDRPNQGMVNEAIAILTSHNTQYGGAATETMKQQCVYSIFSAMGGPGVVAEPYVDAVAGADTSDTSDPDAAAKEEARAQVIRDAVNVVVSGITADANPSGPNITLNEEAASFLEIDEGKYVLENSEAVAEPDTGDATDTDTDTDTDADEAPADENDDTGGDAEETDDGVSGDETQTDDEDEDNEEVTDLSTLTRKELRKLGQSRGIDGASHMSKGDLIKEMS